ncbi:protein of unknown function DUF58 [Xylanimonas cellulosilytica DSM 15894]|uniref:DUF58 domain-containing protein n=1 Tax=Xylanimonas cellulosilytica (strain DSM 15894 / JCM 12276 / CECT 5975 / KCTC 9989 / LMG 20990 / NBRC 107835 / XIL07) TaxID=446471 RepID=D1BW22_XYLCX|nr:DUF58 domain-containing protein [Xylanimonas cellulosilytica]ACZ29525.1 protein of unknown function DUF58 [Xylanimonas cellulosilytica DSM 15894]
MARTDLPGTTRAAYATVRVALRRAWDPAAALLRRVTAPLTAVASAYGIAAFVVAIAAWVAGLTLAWQELMVVAQVLSVTLVAAVAFVLGRFRYTVALDLAQSRVTVGDRAVGRLVVRNETARALLPSVMEVPVGQGAAAFPVPRLRPGREHEEVFTIPTRRRSVISVGPVRSVRADPLGLLRREMSWTEPQELYVHPVVKSLSGSSTGFLKDLEGRVTQDISNSDVSFHALRDYVPGDDRRHIHWKTTARTGQLMVRQFEETRRSHLAVLLSTRAEDYASDDEFELAVSVCGSLGLQAIKEDRGVTVLVNSGSLRGDHRTRLLDDLARIERTPSRTRLADVARLAAHSVTDASVVAFVVGSGVPPADLRAASARMPQDVTVMALQCVPGASLSRRTIAELTVLTLGGLGELPLALRRVNEA